jgi:AraC-like DNA-binding protein
MEDRNAYFSFDIRPSASPLVETVWRTESERAGTFTSTAETHWEMGITRIAGELTNTMRGPETKAKPAPFPKDAEFLGIIFKYGAFMPHLPVSKLVDGDVNLPKASNGAFWLHSATWELPNFENADAFISRLVREEMLVFDPVVEAVLENRPVDLSLRTVQRRFLRATGITRGTFDQIERAKQAAVLLQKGTSIADAIFQAGYADQPHLTRSLKRFVGQTPRQILQSENAK